MIEYLVIIFIIGAIVSIITEQLLFRRLKLEEGVTVSKGKCILKPGYGLLPPPQQLKSQNALNPLQTMGSSSPEGRDFSGIGRNNLTDNHLSEYYKPLKI